MWRYNKYINMVLKFNNYTINLPSATLGGAYYWRKLRLDGYTALNLVVFVLIRQ